MNHENVGFKQQTWWNLADFTMKVGLTTQKDDEFTNKMSDLRSGNPTQGKSPLLTCNHLQASYFDSVHLEVCLDIGRKMLDDKKESPLEFQELLAASFALQHPRYVYLERALDIPIGTTTCSPTEPCWAVVRLRKPSPKAKGASGLGSGNLCRFDLASPMPTPCERLHHLAFKCPHVFGEWKVCCVRTCTSYP